MKLEKTLQTYFDNLDRYTEEQFLQKPAEDKWSLGQIYIHVILGNDHFFMKQADKCLNKEETQQGRGKNRGAK